MIKYHHGTWGMQVLCRLKGSVVPKALIWSVPCAGLTIAFHILLRESMAEAMGEGQGIDSIWSGYTFILGFLIVFRSNQAYSRFWESVTLTHKIRGQWTNAFSSMLAFCSTAPEKQEDVHHFREYLMRLMSLLHCYSLHQVCELADDQLEVIDLSGLSPDTVDYLHSCTSSDRAETVMLWIERLIVEGDQNKIFEVAPPVLSRVFQELSAGMVNMSELRKITEVPFPFPYSQFLSYMLVLQWLVSPVVVCQLISKWWWAGSAVWLLSTSYWTLFYIAQEIDMPFGEDSNDLPVEVLQHEFNESLLHLSTSQSYILPDFVSAIAVKRTTCMSMTRKTLRASKLHTTFPKLKKALSDQWEREERAAELLEIDRQGQWQWHPTKVKVQIEETSIDSEEAEEVGIEPSADPVLVSRQGIKTALGPRVMEAAARRGISTDRAVEMQVLEDIVLEAVEGESRCPSEDVMALVGLAGNPECGTVQTSASSSRGSGEASLSLNQLMQRLKDLSSKALAGAPTWSQAEDVPSTLRLQVKDRHESLNALIQALSGTLRRPNRPEVQWNV